jgi:hypothetical protein
VLKFGDTYTVTDTPSVDETLAADKVYMGGHIYTVDSDEAADLVAAGFSVTGVLT